MLREAALALFLIAVALGLWLADVRPLAVVGVMALALAVAWVIEWVSWREDQLQGMPPVRQEVQATEIAAEPPPVTAEPPPVAAEPPPVTAEPPPVAAEPPPVPEPVPAAAPRARGLWLRRPKRASGPAEDVPTKTAEEALAPADASEGVGAGHAQPGIAGTPDAEPEPPVAEEPPPSKRRLQPVQSAAPPPPPAPEPPASPQPPEPQGAPVVPLWARSSQPREWNLWDLERIARAQSRRDPERFEEWSYLCLHLRRFANADGMLPAEFDGLVRDSFGGLLEPAQGA
jgi:hypothetical protein